MFCKITQTQYNFNYTFVKDLDLRAKLRAVACVYAGCTRAFNLFEKRFF